MTSAASVPPRTPRYPAGSPCPRSSRSQHASRRPTRGDDLTRGAGIGRCGSGVLRCRHFDGCCAIDQRAFALGPRCSVLRGPEHVDVLDTAPRRRDDEDSKTKRTRKAPPRRTSSWPRDMVAPVGSWLPRAVDPGDHPGLLPPPLRCLSCHAEYGTPVRREEDHVPKSSLTVAGVGPDEVESHGLIPPHPCNPGERTPRPDERPASPPSLQFVKPDFTNCGPCIRPSTTSRPIG